MKGDRGFDVLCPLGCGILIRGRMRHHGTRTMTARSAMRHAVREHLNNHHVALSSREASLICDRAVDV